MGIDQSAPLLKLECLVTAGHQGLNDRQVLKENASKGQGPSLYGEMGL